MYKHKKYKMTPKKIEGILAAVPTPLTADGKALDLENIKRQTERYIKGGIHGIVTTGTTGEFPALSVEEQKQVIKAYINAAEGRITVVSGIGCTSTEMAIEMVQFAENSGADAVMVVPPYYDPLAWKELYQFYEDVCGSINIPLIYYNLPHATGVKLDANQLRELGKIKNFDYLKDTSGNAKELTDLLTNPVEGLTAFCGWDTLTFFALAGGAEAIVWGVASIVPRECVDLWDAFQAKDLDKARRLWKFLWEVSDFMEQGSYPVGIKTGHEIICESVGPVRKPNLPLSEEAYAKITTILAKRVYK